MKFDPPQFRRNEPDNVWIALLGLVFFIYLFIGDSYLFSRFSEASLLFLFIVILQKNKAMSKKKEIVKLVIEQLLTCNAKIAEALEVLYEDDEILNNQESVPIKLSEKRQYKGLAGIAEIFGCSIATASRMKKSGILDSAISQIGRTFIVDKEKALELAKLDKKRSRTHGRKHSV